VVHLSNRFLEQSCSVLAMAHRVAVLVATCLALCHGLRRKARRPASCGAQGFSASAALVAKGNETSFVNIFNGQPAKACAWKWQVGVRRSRFRPAHCGGMLIAKDWVLTAAQCVGSSSTNVVAGKYNLRSKNAGEQARRSKRIIKHPNYNQPVEKANDIALIQLESPMEMTDCVGTVCLPSVDVSPGSKCMITGWGRVTRGLFQPDRLQEGEVTVLSNEECRASKHEKQITDDMLCAQGKTEDGRIVDACVEDSGGPLVCEDNGVYTVYGVTSWFPEGRGCAWGDYPGVWSRVHHHLDWIAKTMAS